MIDTWIVVADGGSARIFSGPADLSKLGLVLERKNGHHHPDHHADPEKGDGSEHHRKEIAFAEDLGREVVSAVGSHEVRSVVLVAPPRFITDLVASLPASTVGHITAKIGKDYTKVKPHDLANRVKQALAAR